MISEIWQSNWPIFSECLVSSIFLSLSFFFNIFFKRFLLSDRPNGFTSASVLRAETVIIIIFSTGGRLTKIHLTFSVDWKFLIIWAFDRILFWRLIKSLKNESFIFYHLIEFFETFQLIETFINVILNFWSTAKKEPTDFGTWSKF